MKLDALIDLCQLSLGDPSGIIYPDDDVATWIVEACRDYATHFHRTRELVINCTLGTHNYDLPGDYIDVVSVEYPDGQSPPHFLKRLSMRRARFWQSDDYYDLVPSDYASVPGVLWISAEPTADQDITLTYLAAYWGQEDDDPDAEDIEDILVPAHHIPIIVQYVYWRGLSHHLAQEHYTPEYDSDVLNDMTLAVKQARTTYEASLSAANKATSTTALTDPWTTDRWDRIY